MITYVHLHIALHVWHPRVAYASRVYSFLCTQALTWKTEYTRDAYATVGRNPRVQISKFAGDFTHRTSNFEPAAQAVHRTNV